MKCVAQEHAWSIWANFGTVLLTLTPHNLKDIEKWPVSPLISHFSGLWGATLNAACCSHLTGLFASSRSHYNIWLWPLLTRDATKMEWDIKLLFGTCTFCCTVIILFVVQRAISCCLSLFFLYWLYVYFSEVIVHVYSLNWMSPRVS